MNLWYAWCSNSILTNNRVLSNVTLVVRRKIYVLVDYNWKEIVLVGYLLYKTWNDVKLQWIYHLAYLSLIYLVYLKNFEILTIASILDVIWIINISYLTFKLVLFHLTTLTSSRESLLNANTDSLARHPHIEHYLPTISRS